MDRKIYFVGLGSLLLIAAVAASTFLLSRPPGFRGVSFGEPFPPAPEIELTQTNGELFRLTEQRGKIILLFFGYTSCPDVCPTTLAELKQVLDKMGEKANSVEVVFVTVDPERDAPEKIRKYLDHFNSSFIGLSGSQAELEKVWSDYGVFREVVKEENTALGYIVNHTARVTLIDAAGNMRLSYGFQTPVDDIVHDLKLLLK